MFKYFDGTQSPPGQKQIKAPIAIRKVTYINPHPNPKVKEPVVTEGFEIVSEAILPPGMEIGAVKIVGSKTVEFVPPVKKIKKQDSNREESNGQD